MPCMIVDMSAIDKVSFGVLPAMTLSDGRFAAGVTPEVPVFGLRVGVMCIGPAEPDAPETPPGGVVLPLPTASGAVAPPRGGAIAHRGVRGLGRMESFSANLIREDQTSSATITNPFRCYAV